MSRRRLSSDMTTPEGRAGLTARLRKARAVSRPAHKLLDYDALSDGEVVKLAQLDIRMCGSISSPVVDQLVKRGLRVDLPNGKVWKP